MRCPDCGNDVPDRAVLCPNCGVTVEETQPSRPTAVRATELHPDEAAASNSARRVRPFLLWGLGFFLVLIISVGSGAYFGVREGEELRVRRLRQEAEQHYQLGLKRLDEGNDHLARAEFEYVLKIDPNHVGAEQGLIELDAQAEADPTPTKKPEEPIAEVLYRRAASHYDAERWQDAAATLTSLRQLDASYKPEEVEEMLFESRYRAGMELLEQDDYELGIFYLDRAVALRPLDEEARRERRLATAYVQSLSYWGADWERTIEELRELYRTAPDYEDVFQRLYEAHLEYAEAWESQGDMCPAVEQYDQALRLMNTAELQDRRAESAEICRNATPTPVATIEGSQSVTQTVLPPGFNAGRLAYPVYDTASGTWNVYAVFADGRLLQMVAGADQPIWMWNSHALGYRDRLSPGIALKPSLQASPQRLVDDAGLAWPTFSPDGQRVAYAEPDPAGDWQIMVGPTDGSADAQRHAAGWGPAWGPTGLLAWTGCEPEDPEACGIFIDNPDDDQPANRVSGSADDVGLSWSPGGNQLAYMSDHTGNWEIYIYNLGGGFQVLTDHPAADGLPAWSPDGSAIAFVSDRGGGWHIYLMRPGGEDPRQVISLGPNYPNWTQQRLSWGVFEPNR